jgi:pantoate--beta-alanine ligase
MIVFRTLADLGAALKTANVGLVPTMGALHDGHLALIRQSADENERTVVSVFINPTQFNDPADLAAYPRDFDRDAHLAAEAGADIIYAPDVAQVYPDGFATSVEVAGLTDRWEGKARPGHFNGVVTVVTILINSVRPARSYFGEKDFQQLVVVRRLHRDLALPGQIIGCPTIRDEDGLALSSRNARLTPKQRTIAAGIPKALLLMAKLAADGERDTRSLIRAGLNQLEEGIAVDYLTVVNPTTLEPIETVTLGSRAMIAAKVGSVRLIDNIEFNPP